MMFLLSSSTRRQAAHALLEGLILLSTISPLAADDKTPKNHRNETRGTERVARVERNPANTEITPRNFGSNHGGGMSNHQKFQPVFSREEARAARQSQAVNLEPSRLPPTPAPKLTPNLPNLSSGLTPRVSPSIPTSNGPQYLTLARGERGSQNTKESNKSKAPKVERVNPPKQEQPKPPTVKPPVVNNPPQVVVPKVELPKPENKSQKPDQPKIRVPESPNKHKSDQSGGSSGPIRIPREPATKINPDNDSTTGKIKIRTPQPDIKLNGSANKGRGTGADQPIHPREADPKPDKSVRLKDGGTLTRDHHERIKLDLDKQHRDLVNGGKIPDHAKVKLPPQIKVAGHERLEKLPRESLKLPVPKNGNVDPAVAAKLKLHPAREVLNTRLKNGDFKHLSNSKGGQQFQLHKQFELRQQGDLSRRLNLVSGLHQRGGWRHRFYGPISPIYSRHCRSMWYAGPSFCAPYVWYPSWSPWVDWCWWDTCAPIYDPRPIYCQPVIYDPCGPWVAWNFPTWQPLPYVTCGTWVDVEPVVINSGIDLQLLATRFVDPGHPDQQLGPRFRMWLRNNSPIDMNQPFNVLLIASNDANAYAGLPEAGIRIPSIRAGETKAVDIRLPYSANSMGRDSSGNAIPFTYLTALVDSHNELPETFENNNGATLIRGDILPVDPSAFAAEPGSAQPNGVIHVAGEGLGPEPGQAMVVIGDQEFQAEIVGWFDLGVQIRLPNFELDNATAADLVIIRGDGAASNPLTIEIDPNATLAAAPVPPVPELPEPPPLPVPSI